MRLVMVIGRTRSARIGNEGDCPNRQTADPQARFTASLTVLRSELSELVGVEQATRS